MGEDLYLNDGCLFHSGAAIASISSPADEAVNHVNVDVHDASVDVDVVLKYVFDVLYVDCVSVGDNLTYRSSVEKDVNRVAMMQPSLFPWAGFFELILKTDTFIFLDDFKFTKQSWGHRNKFFVGNKNISMYTLPIVHTGSLESTFLETKEHDPVRSRKKFLTRLQHGYAKSPYFDDVYSLFQHWLSQDYESVADLEFSFLRIQLEYLNIDRNIVRSSELGLPQLNRSDRLRAIFDQVKGTHYYSANGSFDYMREDGVFPLPGVPTYFQDHKVSEYDQGNRGMDFYPYLPLFDFLFYNDPNNAADVIRGTQRWVSWRERLVASS